jgi:hypothetical protein
MPIERVNRDAARPRIPFRDESDLMWYLTEGASIFERSAFGAMLERVEFFAYRTVPCPKCNGHGAVNSKTRTAPTEPDDLVLLDTFCSACNGTGEVPSKGPRGAKEPTVKITAERQSHGYCPSDSALRRMARVTRRLNAIERTGRKGAMHCEVLRRFYGLQGQSWAHEVRTRRVRTGRRATAGQ